MLMHNDGTETYLQPLIYAGGVEHMQAVIRSCNHVSWKKTFKYGTLWKEFIDIKCCVNKSAERGNMPSSSKC